MRYILLSADTQPILYEAPDGIAAALHELADQFLYEVNCKDSSYWRQIRDPSGAQYDSLCYTLDDFVAWLNKRHEGRRQLVRLPAHLPMEEREIIMETALKEQNLPIHQQQYPWVNL